MQVDESPFNGLGLLISVRNVDEARIVDQANVDILDIKEPHHGALGKADDWVIDEILKSVGRSNIVSAAFGEVSDCESYLQTQSVPSRLDFAKCGLAGAIHSRWQDRVRAIWSIFRKSCSPVAVAYADHEQADSPRPDEVLELAIQEGVRYFLIDTFSKVNQTSLTILGHSKLMQLIDRGHAAGIKTVLAGSLAKRDVHSAIQMGTDLVGVRGAVCQSDRTGNMDGELVRQFKRCIEEECLQNR